MTKVDRPRWVLAFDASCLACRRVADSVEEACGDELEIMPLNHKDVHTWRTQAFGGNAPWAPTLVKVEKDSVNAWAGRSMAPRLVRHLGLSSTIRVIRALGQLSAVPAHPEPEGKSPKIARKRFLQIGFGMTVAVGLLTTGQIPAFARSGPAKARAWVEANKAALPDTYKAVTSYPLEYRKAIFTTLPVEKKINLWLEQIRLYRAEHPSLSAIQDKVLRRATDFLSTTGTRLYTLSAQTKEVAEEVDRTKVNLRKDAIEAFGYNDARLLIGTLGRDDFTIPSGSHEAGATALDCECNNPDSWCGWGWACWSLPQIECDIQDGCGEFWCCVCNGRCVDV